MTSPTWMCGNCKANVSPRQSFCSDCGKKLDWDDVRVEPKEDDGRYTYYPTFVATHRGIQA